MKQKLGLACTLVRSPKLLLLDEPTVGVDPLSRRELWAILRQLVQDQGLTVLMSTSYLDEAEHSSHAIVFHQGHVLAQGEPESVSRLAMGRTFLVDPAPGETARGLQARLLEESGVVDAVPEGGRVRLVVSADTDEKSLLAAEPAAGKAVATEPHFEDGFMVLLREKGAERTAAGPMTLDRPPDANGGQSVVQADELVRRFGAFTAVDHVSFEVHRGEVFGLLGPNGAGKTTTFRMLCGLLPASGGMLRVAGVDLRTARASARQRIGYVAQKFSLYGQLSVLENLDFFSAAYGLRGRRKNERIRWALEQFQLEGLSRLPSQQLPGGYKQRLAMAAALLHEPGILFLDEPTSGVDPLARREFWQRITALAEQGVTVIVTTHFMEEAEYCDRVAILDAGRILATGTPAEIRARAPQGPTGGESSMEEAFIAVVEEARDEQAPQTAAAGTPAMFYGSEPAWLPAKAQRVWALVQKETRQMLRDSSSIAIGIVLPVVLILLFGYGLSLDVKDAPLAVVMEEPSPEATELAAGFQFSPYFDTVLMTSMADARQLMLARKIDAIVLVRANFGRQVNFGDAQVQLLVHGTDGNRARIIESYAMGAIGQLGRTASGRRPVGGRGTGVH